MKKVPLRKAFMEQIKELIENLIARTDLRFERLPDIDLYMDQVIEYLSRHSVSQRDNDKISSAMINNYIKDGLLPRANDKKYNREHLAFLLMIARLKQNLSVKDTGVLLKAITDGKDVSRCFDSFQALVANTASDLEKMLPEDESRLCDVALHLAVSSYVNRLVCELILSRLGEEIAPENEEKPLEKDEGKEKSDKKEKK